MRETACERKETKNRSRGTKRLWALILVMALVLSLLPAAFAEDGSAGTANRIYRGELSVTPTTILETETAAARIVSTLSQSPDESNEWEGFVVEMENKEEWDHYFWIKAVMVNGKLIDVDYSYKLRGGEKAEGKLLLNKTLMALAGISKIETMKIAFSNYDEAGNLVNTKWVNVPVKDSRQNPYSAEAKEIVLMNEAQGMQLTLLGMEEQESVVKMYFKFKNNWKDMICDEFTPCIVSLNGDEENPIKKADLGVYGVPPKTTVYYAGYLIKTTDEPLREIEFMPEVVDPRFGVHCDYYEIRVKAEIDDALIQTNGLAAPPYSDEELLTMARDAEESFEDYATVSTGKVSLELPYGEDYFTEPLETEIKFTKGGAVLILPKPATGNGNLGSIAAGTKVTAIAEYKGYYFFVADDGRMGWTGKDNLEA